MIEIAEKHQFYSFDAQGMEPVTRVESGCIVRFHTQDCYAGLLKTEQTRRADIVHLGPPANPTTGPVYVEGAQPGDTLKVEVLAIYPSDHATMRVRPGVGALGDAVEEEHVRIFPINSTEWIDFDGLRVDLRPMIGVIGVAPKEGQWDTDTPYKHGGNMDNRDITAGCTLYFPVHQAGALFGLGDVHAQMGDGEVCICGLEMAATVDVRLSVVKGRQEEWPMWERDGRWSVMCSEKTLDEAAKDARYAMLRFLKKRVDIPNDDLTMLLSLVGDTAVCQVVDPLQTVRFTLRQRIGDVAF